MNSFRYAATALGFGSRRFASRLMNGAGCPMTFLCARPAVAVLNNRRIGISEQTCSISTSPAPRSDIDSVAQTYKYSYFDKPHRGEPIRVLFAAAGVKFVDDRAQLDDWPSLQKTPEWGQFPLLQVGDRTLTQDMTIARYLARQFKLVGANDWEAAKCDELVDASADIMEEFIAIEWEEIDSAKKEQRQKKFSSELLPDFLNKINKAKIENGGQWLVGKNMTWADIVIAERLRQFVEKDWNKTDLSKYPETRKMFQAVFANEGIKQYLKSAN